MGKHGCNESKYNGGCKICYISTNNTLTHTFISGYNGTATAYVSGQTVNFTTISSSGITNVNGVFFPTSTGTHNYLINVSLPYTLAAVGTRAEIFVNGISTNVGATVSTIPAGIISFSAIVSAANTIPISIGIVSGSLTIDDATITITQIN
jgi:hypothetical protein